MCWQAPSSSAPSTASGPAEVIRRYVKYPLTSFNAKYLSGNVCCPVGLSCISQKAWGYLDRGYPDLRYIYNVWTCNDISHFETGIPSLWTIGKGFHKRIPYKGPNARGKVKSVPEWGCPWDIEKIWNMPGYPIIFKVVWPLSWLFLGFLWKSMLMIMITLSNSRTNHYFPFSSGDNSFRTIRRLCRTSYGGPAGPLQPNNKICPCPPSYADYPGHWCHINLSWKETIGLQTLIDYSGAEVLKISQTLIIKDLCKFHGIKYRLFPVDNKFCRSTILKKEIMNMNG